MSPTNEKEEIRKEIILKGKLTGFYHETVAPNLLRFRLVGYRDDGTGELRLPSHSGWLAALTPYVDKYIVIKVYTDDEGFFKEVSEICQMTERELQEFKDNATIGATRDRISPPRALSFSGTWGPRISLPSAMTPDDVDAFDASLFSKQLKRLGTASYVMINVTHPANGRFFTGPHPHLAAVLNLSVPAFPTRDVLGETLDVIADSGKKALVYFAAEGFHSNRAEEQVRAAWDEYVSKKGGASHAEATAESIVGYYAKRYGSKIHGWWFDGSNGLNVSDRQLWKRVVTEGNSEAIVAFNRMAGVPYRSTKECDYFGGHPTPQTQHKFWDKVNLAMIEAVEAGPWMGCKGEVVEDSAIGALGHVFMGMQDRWNFGGLQFPPDQAVDWTSRVLKAGGMYTWHVPRQNSQMARKQFGLLLKIDDAVAKLSISPTLQPSRVPSYQPYHDPTDTPTIEASVVPSLSPSYDPIGYHALGANGKPSLQTSNDLTNSNNKRSNISSPIPHPYVSSTPTH